MNKLRARSSNFARFLLLGVSLLQSPVSLAEESCETNGVVLGYFNGVQTTKEQANNALTMLRQQYLTTTPKGEAITYELFYNDSEGFSDFVETFEQRLQEHNGLLAGRYELFFSAAAGQGRWWDALTSAVPALGEVLGRLVDRFNAQLIRDLTADFGRPETFVVAQRHRDQIAHWASLDKKMLFLAHSQGNLFVNAAYDHAVGLTDAKSVCVVHVAPASPRATGAHTLANLDLVINGLRLVGGVLPNTDEIAPWAQRPPGLSGKRDPVGHGLLEIYLNPALSTSSRIRAHVMTALQELESPDREPMPPYPDFVAQPWTGGDSPTPITSARRASHEIERVVHQRSFPYVFVKRRNDPDEWVEDRSTVGQGPDSGWSRTQIFGRGMAGSQQCDWGLHPVAGWAEPLHLVQCQTVHFPVEIHYNGRNPLELDTYQGAQVGARVQLNTQTYRADVYAKTQAGRNLWIEFYSGNKPLQSSGIENERRWVERYVVEEQQLVNQNAIRDWNTAFTSHLRSELRRFETYGVQKEEYERRRQACDAPPPPPPPPPPDPGPDPAPEGCSPSDLGGEFCPS